MPRSLDSRIARLEGREPPTPPPDPLWAEAQAVVASRLERPPGGALMDDPVNAAILIETARRMNAAIACGRGARELRRIEAETPEPPADLVAEIEALGPGGLYRLFREIAHA